jgi:hypothetical protein
MRRRFGAPLQNGLHASSDHAIHRFRYVVLRDRQRLNGVEMGNPGAFIFFRAKRCGNRNGGSVH